MFTKKKKKYQKPAIKSEKIFETAALACAKCQNGPTGQAACKALRRWS